MRDRIGAVGGELRIVSVPGVGTTVRGTVPLDHGLTGEAGRERAVTIRVVRLRGQERLRVNRPCAVR